MSPEKQAELEGTILGLQFKCNELEVLLAPIQLYFDCKRMHEQWVSDPEKNVLTGQKLYQAWKELQKGY